jgi:hypothetical protein
MIHSKQLPKRNSIFFAGNKLAARFYARNVLKTKLPVRMAKKQIPHVAKWKTWQVQGNHNQFHD